MSKLSFRISLLSNRIMTSIILENDGSHSSRDKIGLSLNQAGNDCQLN